MKLSRRSRDMHILKELSYGLNQLHSLAARYRADADNVENMANMMQSKLDTIATDVMNVNGQKEVEECGK